MRVLLIHTGGTIGMVHTDDGFAPSDGVVDDAVHALTARGTVGAAVDIHKLEPLMDSAQATPQDWNRIARTVFEADDGYDGFVVTHGSDTLAYSAAAMCMALPGLRKPVILTGAMLPLTVEGSDGWRNLIDALTSAGTAPPGVWVQFGGRLLHGAKVRKSHSSSLDAFEAGRSSVPPVLPATGFGLNLARPNIVGVFSVTPGPCIGLLDFAAGHCDGLVLRCYGSGTAPDTPEMRAALQKAWDRAVPVVAVSQCPEGGMKLGTYAAGKVMRDTGVIDGRDMTPEMAYTKVHYGLSLSAEFEKRRAFLGGSLCGELTPDPEA